MIPANQDCSHTVTRTLNKNGQNARDRGTLSIFPLCTQKVLFGPTRWTLMTRRRNMEGCQWRGARPQFPFWIQSRDFSQVTWLHSIRKNSRCLGDPPDGDGRRNERERQSKEPWWSHSWDVQRHLLEALDLSLQEPHCYNPLGVCVCLVDWYIPCSKRKERQ